MLNCAIPSETMAMAENLWRECVLWLIECRVIPPDHKANWPDSEIKVLAIALRDGVLLCNLMTFLDPSANHREFHRKPQMAQVKFSTLIFTHWAKVNPHFSRCRFPVLVLPKHQTLPRCVPKSFWPSRSGSVRAKHALRLVQLPQGPHHAFQIVSMPSSSNTSSEYTVSLA